MHLASIIQQIAFALIAFSAIYMFSKKIKSLRRNVLIGKPIEFSGTSGERWKNVLLLAFGQKKMFKNIPVAILHFFIYAGFIIINTEIIEIILDGLLGTHRIFLSVLGANFYSFLINTFEVLALLTLVAVIIFLIRRNVTKVKRLNTSDLDGFPRKDANTILYFEIVLMSLFLIMNACDLNLQQVNNHYPATNNFIISGNLASLFSSLSPTTLYILERTCWLLHIVGIFAFLNYLPYSKHLHILFSFPNAYYAPLETDFKGTMQNMQNVQNEVLYMMEPDKAPTTASNDIPKFGAKDVQDLSWKNLMDAYSCTECGRCSSACPANQTGKKLSPRRIMMATRDRLEDVGKVLDANNNEWKDDGKTLLNDYISVEELRACTTCNACVEECPVSINPLSIITELRRSLVMEDSNAPQEWNQMFSNIENNMAPWKFSPDERDAWINS